MHVPRHVQIIFGLTGKISQKEASFLGRTVYPHLRAACTDVAIIHQRSACSWAVFRQEVCNFGQVLTSVESYMNLNTQWRSNLLHTRHTTARRISTNYANS